MTPTEISRFDSRYRNIVNAEDKKRENTRFIEKDAFGFVGVQRKLISFEP